MLGLRADTGRALAGVAGAVALLAACSGGSASDAEPGRISFGKLDPEIGDFRIWTAAADGSDERPLVRRMSWMSDWAPDGRRLVFEDATTLTTIAPDGSDPQVVVDSLGYQGVPKWSPTGEWIAFEGSEQAPSDPIDIPQDFSRSVWVVRPDGRDLHRVTDRFDVEPVFSPDGSQLAFGHVTEPGQPWDAVQSVVVVGLDGTGRREVVPPTIGLQHLDWSPDGTWITYNVEPLPGIVEQPDGSGSIWAVHSDGTDRHVLVPSTDEWMFVKPVWSPDGRRLLAGCNTPGSGVAGGGIDRLCVVDVASGEATLLIDHSAERLDVNFPAWGTSQS
jgi:Tol biopolymer transport system component